jgi:hypothetical protein
MRPDCSIRIQPVDAPADTHEEIWVHFDAKYRVHEVTQIFDEDDPAVEVTSDALPMGRAKGADLLKMHAYRDAIRRSAGAYVLYPGTVSETLREYHELLPGLGAFPLVPTDTGMASGAHSIRGFIRDILDHSASQLTQHERGRYWTAESYRPDPQVEPLPVPTAPFLPRPPADTLVLLGYVKSDAHRRWIHDRGIYNLRADPSRDGSVHIGSRELAADLAVLYGPDRDYAEIFAIGEGVESMRREELEERGYADPRGEQYFVLPVEEVEARRWRRILTCASIDAIVADLEPHRALRAPRVVSWSRLVRELDDRSLL